MIEIPHSRRGPMILILINVNVSVCLARRQQTFIPPPKWPRLCRVGR